MWGSFSFAAVIFSKNDWFTVSVFAWGNLVSFRNVAAYDHF
jgi:hypothetical protein